MNGNAEANYSLQNLKGKISFIPAVDNTLTKAGCPADAKETGKKISSIQFQIDSIDPSFAENVGFDNANSGLDATNVQSALKELCNKTSKATGSYTGNGSATARSIYIGGSGGVLAVFSGSYMIGFITQNGAVFFATGDSSVKCFPVAQAKFMSGTLTLASSDNFLNGNGSTYHYQVL